MSAAEEARVEAAIMALLSELDGILFFFYIKRRKIKMTGSFSSNLNTVARTCILYIFLLLLKNVSLLKFLKILTKTYFNFNLL